MDNVLNNLRIQIIVVKTRIAPTAKHFCAFWRKEVSVFSSALTVASFNCCCCCFYSHVVYDNCLKVKIYFKIVMYECMSQ